MSSTSIEEIDNSKPKFTPEQINEYLKQKKLQEEITNSQVNTQNKPVAQPAAQPVAQAAQVPQVPQAAQAPKDTIPVSKDLLKILQNVLVVVSKRGGFVLEEYKVVADINEKLTELLK